MPSLERLWNSWGFVHAMPSPAWWTVSSPKALLPKTRKENSSIRALNGEVPLLGIVEAGFPSPAEEELIDTMSLDEYLIENKEASYILRVKGDSMIDAGIREGDLVIVERTNAPRVGDIVIAEVDGEWTMKYLRKRGTASTWRPPTRAISRLCPRRS